MIDNQDMNLQELREEATDLGIKFQENWKIETLQKKIDTKLESLSKDQATKKVAKATKNAKKIKVIIEPRDRDDNIVDQYFSKVSMAEGTKESILVLFGEEIDITESMYEFIKSIGGNAQKFRMATDPITGAPKKQWYAKWESRFILEKVD